MNDAIASFLLSSVPQSSQSSLTKIRSWKEIWMARNTADLRDEIMIRDRSPSSARMHACIFRASLFESLGFSANFLPSAPAAGNGESTQSSIFRIKKLSLRFFLSSIPRHRLYFIATSVLTLIPGDPSTRVVAFVTCRKCFSSMREKGSPSRRIGVSFASF